MFKLHIVMAALLVLSAPVARAHGSGTADPALHVNPDLKDCSIQFAPELTQAAFHRFVREFGTASASKFISAPGTLGRGHVALGLEGVAFHIDEHADAWNDTFAHPDATHELGADKRFPKLRARVGLTDRMDVGAFYTANFQANYGWLGLDARYGLLRQRDGMPVDLSVRGAWTKTLYVDDMDLMTGTADVAAGRTFGGIVTPYVGFGGDHVLARETTATVDLKREEQTVWHGLAGVEARLRHFGIGAEVQRSALTSVQLLVTGYF